MELGRLEFLALLGQLRQVVVVFDRVQGFDPDREGLRLVETTAKKARSFEVVAEQIVHGLEITAVELDGFLEGIARLRCQHRRTQRIRGFGPASISLPEPVVVLGILRVGGNGFFEMSADFLYSPSIKYDFARRAVAALSPASASGLTASITSRYCVRSNDSCAFSRTPAPNATCAAMSKNGRNLTTPDPCTSFG